MPDPCFLLSFTRVRVYQSVQLSSKIREQLRTVQETHKKMQTQLAQEEKDLAKGKVTLIIHPFCYLKSSIQK